MPDLMTSLLFWVCLTFTLLFQIATLRAVIQETPSSYMKTREYYEKKTGKKLNKYFKIGLTIGIPLGIWLSVNKMLLNAALNPNIEVTSVKSKY